jgi:hypothetical protein
MEIVPKSEQGYAGQAWALLAVGAVSVESDTNKLLVKLIRQQS